MERKIQEYNVDNLQNFIQLTRELKSFEVTDPENITTVYTFQAYPWSMI